MAFRCTSYTQKDAKNQWLNRLKIVELVATSMLVFVSGQIDATIMSYESKQIGAYVGISNIVLLSMFIYATSPASGGHINPMITWTTVWSGICPLSRGISFYLLYVLSQGTRAQKCL
jgi:glycerol uptake facilitator-like aquaporin